MFRAFCPIQAESEDGKSVTLLPHPAEADFRANFIAIPAAGQDLRLVEMAGGEARPSRNFHELLALAKSIPGLALTILDPQSRLYGQNENDNNAATTFCSVLERLAQETGAGVLCCAHGRNCRWSRRGKLKAAALLQKKALAETGAKSSILGGRPRPPLSPAGVPTVFPEGLSGAQDG